MCVVKALFLINNILEFIADVGIGFILMYILLDNMLMEIFFNFFM
jgi:hypothetical protein